MQLWKFQHDVLDGVRRAFLAGHRAVLIVAPTGSGKTVMGSSIIHSSEEKGKQSMFMAHRRELVEQAANKLLKFGVNHGIIMAGHRAERWRGVQIASIDTLRARYMNQKRKINIPLPNLDILMIDEAHRSCSPTYTKLINHYRDEGTLIIGLTATPVRGDGKGLGNLYTAMVEAPSVMELIRMGHLVQPHYYAPTIPDLTGVKVARGDYVEGQLQDIMDQREPVGDIVTNWLRICPDRKTIVFASGVKHSMHIAEEFKAAGISAEHVDGETSLQDRHAILDRLRAGETQVITNCMVLTEGFDCPDLSCCVLARPTRNVGLYLQMGGRVLRTSEDTGKKDAIIIDHSGNLYEHGFLEDDQGWVLSESVGSKPREERKAEAVRKDPITCVKCSYQYRGMRVCPNCGHEPKPRGEYVETRHADLIEIERRKLKKAAKKKEFTPEEKQEWYSMFYHYALEKGHKEGSVAHKFKEKFGHWPRNMKKFPLEPTPEASAYIRHLNIKSAHRMKRQKEAS